MAFKPVSAATPAPAPSAPSAYRPVSLGAAPTPEGASDESGGPSVFGFLGNVVDEAQGMVQGITSLAGAALGDIANAGIEAVTLGGADTGGFKLDDIAMALPKALAQDYNSRYGVSKFAEGDIWGGLKSILTGLYEHPLSAIGDALMVGSAVKWTAKAGMLGSVDDAARAAGSSLGARVLGPGTEEAASLTGAAGGIPQVLSENPVARLAQRKLYEAMSYGGRGDATAARLGFGGPQDFITGKVNAGAFDEATRATQNLLHAAGEPGTTPMRVLRPTASKFLEKRGVSTILSHMGMGIGDASTKASAAVRGVLEPLDEATQDMVTSIAMGTRGVLPDALPSNATSVDWFPKTQPPDLPDAAELGLAATPGTSPRMLDAAQEFNREFDRAGDPSRVRELNSPHDLTAEERNAVSLTTDDMDSAYDVAQRYADTVQGRIVAQHNYTADVNSSYDGIHYFVEDADGAIHDVSVATPALKEAQEAWSHMALQQNAKMEEMAGLEAELKEMARHPENANPAAEARIYEEMQRLEDEMQNIEVWNSQTFNYTRRLHNAGEGEYDPALQAADRIRNIVYNHATRIEVKNGLTYRKMLDRAFGPQRSEKWSKLMQVVEEQIRLRIDRAMEMGVPKDEWDSIILGVTDETLGLNNPWAEAMWRTNVREVIPFESGDMGIAQAAPAVADDIARAAPDGPVSVGDTIIADRPGHPDGPDGGVVTRVYETTAKDGSKNTWYEYDNGKGGTGRTSAAQPGFRRVEQSATPAPAPAPSMVGAGEPEYMPAGLGGRPGPLRGQLATGERTIDPRPYGGEAEDIAHRLTQRLREATHEAMVENGEFPGLTWTDLAREAETGGMPFPQYFPHIKASKATADVAILNQNRSQMKTVLEGQNARMKKWGGWLYESGTYERNPIRAYEAMFQQVQRHNEFRDAMHLLIDKYGRRVTQDELSAWDLEQRGEVLVSRTGLDGMVNTRSKMITLTHEGVMSGRTLEDATVQALDAVLENAMANSAAGVALDDVWALPKYVAQQMKTAAKLQMPGTFNFYYDSAMGMWKSAALSLSPRWVVNNTLGNSIYMGMSRPGAIRHFVGQLMPGARARFKAAMGEELLGDIERDFMHGEDLLSSTQKLARRSQRADVGWGERVAESPLQQTAAVRGVRSFSHQMRRLNGYVEGAARRGVAIDDIRRANITGFGSKFLSGKQILEDAASRGIADMGEYDRIVKSVNNVLGDYLTMSPVEAQIVRRFIMPFYAFYRHTAKFLARMPFEHPLKMRVLEQLAEVDQQMNPYMPEYMLGTANIMGMNVQFGSANPLEAVTQAYAPAISHPLLGLAVQRLTGTNPFGRKWTNEPPGGSVELFGGDRYVIHRDANGNVTGVQPAGDWAPPLYESILGIVPQAAMIFDPFDRAVAKRIAGPLTGLSFPNYNAETAQYYAVKNQLAALKQAMGTPAP